MVRRRTGGWFDPDVVRAFARRAERHPLRARRGFRLGHRPRGGAGDDVTIPEWRVDDRGRPRGRRRPEVPLPPRSLTRRRPPGRGGRCPLGLGEDERAARRRAGLFTTSAGSASRTSCGTSRASTARVGAGPPARLPPERILARSPSRRPSRRSPACITSAPTAPATTVVRGGGDPARRSHPRGCGCFPGAHGARPHRPARSPDQAADEVQAMVAAGRSTRRRPAPSATRPVAPVAAGPSRPGRRGSPIARSMCSACWRAGSPRRRSPPHS